MPKFKYLKILPTSVYMVTQKGNYAVRTDHASRFDNAGRAGQAYGTARNWGYPTERVKDPAWTVLGNLGDSQCYFGVTQKVDAIQKELLRRVNEEGLKIRLLSPAYTIGISDGMANGTPLMRYSLIGRQISMESALLHLSGSEVQGCIAVVACDKPPVGTLAALLEHNRPAIIMSDGSIRPGINPKTQKPDDIVGGFQNPDDHELALHICPGWGSCGGMFTYNTMQTFFAVVGMEPLHMVTPASQDERRLMQFPNELINYLQILTERDIKPRNIVTPESIRNGIFAALSMGGSTNVMLHSVEIARAAGIDFWKQVISQKEFNRFSRIIPVLFNARPFGSYSMVDLETRGGLPVIVKQLLDAKLLTGSCMTCTGETLEEQVERLKPMAPDHEVVWSIGKPFKPTGGLGYSMATSHQKAVR